MNSIKKILTFSISILFFVACSSDEPTAEPIPIQPKSLTIVTYNEANPTNISYTWQDKHIASYTIKTLNTATNKDFIRKYDINRDAKNFITSILYTYEGGGFPDGSTTQLYTYNADKTQVNYLSTTWKYDKLGNLSTVNYGSRSITGFVEYSYNNTNLLSKLYWKETGNLENINTINAFTQIENPLYNVAKSLQFLNLTFNNTDLILSSLMKLPRSFNNGTIDNFVTYEVDAQNQVTSITVTNNGIVSKKYSFTY
jgi:hypothetical protein